MYETNIGDVIFRSLLMAGAFIFLWLNLAAGPVLGIALGATLLRMISGG
jgi:hypothetical protein